jgi:hypothetical protein
VTLRNAVSCSRTSNWWTDEIGAVDLEGNSEVIGAGGGGSGWAVHWLLDGRMLVTGGELLRSSPQLRLACNRLADPIRHRP